MAKTDISIQPGDSVHIVGVAGVGMNPLAQVALAMGCTVSGSDRYYDQGRSVPVLDMLARMGIVLSPQDGSGLTSTTKAVLVSTAIEKDNPDLLRAHALGLPIIHRARALAHWVGSEPLIAIAGTSGKTTVTGIVGWILQAIGWDPRVVNGGAIVNWKTKDQPGNVSLKGTGPWVLEVDESDKSLLEFTPDWAVLTNISHDHFPLAETIDLFQTFAAQIKKTLIAGPDVLPLLKTSSLQCDCVEAMAPVQLLPDLHAFRYKDIQFEVPLPGAHNRINAICAVSLCDVLGCDLMAVREALKTFRGIERRLEVIGERDGIRVIDDYGHNPAKIQAAWSAVAPSAQRVLAVWRPHGFGPLAAMMDELEETFATVCRPSDHLYLLPVFYAGGTTSRQVSSEDLVDRLKARGVQAHAISDYDALDAAMRAEACAGDLVLCMGARDPDLPLFARSFIEERKGQ